MSPSEMRGMSAEYSQLRSTKVFIHSLNAV